MDWLRVKNWESFQHYKKRNPPWIKLHRAAADDYALLQMPDAAKLLLPWVWSLASSANGRIPADPEFMRAKLMLAKAPDLKPLIEAGFLIPERDASNAIEPCMQDVSLRREETETEKRREEKATSGKPDFKASAIEVLNFLNDKASRGYQPVAANLEVIVARLKDGATVEDCRMVIAKKVREWLGDEKMSVYLRPATLFNRTKFAQYMGELV